MNIEEAESTYFSSVIEYAEDCTEEEKEQAMIDFTYEKNNLICHSISLSKLSSYLKIHSSKYENHQETEKDFNNIKFSTIIVVFDELNNKYLIIDGNHRVNTYFEKYPDWEMNVILISAKIFKNMGIFYNK